MIKDTQKTFVLIHGVGKQSFGKATTKWKERFQNDKIIEINWHNASNTEGFWGHVSWLARIAKALLVASSSDIKEYYSTKGNFLSKVVRVINLMLVVSNIFIPLIGFFWLIGKISVLMYSSSDIYGYPHHSWRAVKLFISGIYPSSWYGDILPIINWLALFYCFLVVLHFVSLFISNPNITGVKIFVKSILLKLVFPFFQLLVGLMVIVLITVILFLVFGLETITDTTIIELTQSSQSGTFFSLVNQFAYILIPAIIALIVFMVLVMPILKIFADIFLYISDADQRERIQETLFDKTSGISSNQEIILVGHSLGSIIAIDYLLHTTQWKTARSIHLITMGSPLYKLLNKFFPYYLSELRIIASYLFSSNKIRWTNIYRPADPIGTILPSDGIINVNSKQYGKQFIYAHTNYWFDDQILDIVSEQLNANKEYTYLLKEASTVEFNYSLGLYPFDRKKVKRTIYQCLYAISFCMLLLVIINHVWLLDMELNAFEKHKEKALKSYGIKYESKVYFVPEEIYDLKTKHYYTINKIFFYLNEKEEHIVEAPYASVNKPKLISDLQQHIRANYGEENENKFFSFINDVKHSPVEILSYYKDSIIDYDFTKTIALIPEDTLIENMKAPKDFVILGYPYQKDFFFGNLLALVIVIPIAMVVIIFFALIGVGLPADTEYS